MNAYRKINTYFFFVFFTSFFKFAYTQKKDSLHISVIADSYISWNPESSKSKRLPYAVNYHRLNSADFNFLAATLHYRNNHFRTSLGVMNGSYTDKNMLQEDPWARKIYEANIGYRFTSDEEVWLDIGVLPSHIGFEAVPANKNWSGTRSLVADLSPYYETGLRLSYRPNPSWYFAIFALNGWQRITAPLNQFGESWGMQITYQPEPNWLINSSSFIGKVPLANEAGTRIYSNLYSTLQLNPRMWVMAGWDWGMQENKSIQWNDILLQYRYAFFYNKLYGNLRYEYLADPQALFIPASGVTSNRVHQTSLNMDFLPVKQCMLRAEINYQFSPERVFYSNDQPGTNQMSVFVIGSIQLDYKK